MRLSLSDLSDRTNVSGRAIRFYIQKGLISPPRGAKRGAYYDDEHLAALLRIREWQEAGLSLDAIGQLLEGASPVPVPPARIGAIEVRSHLIVADGIELVIAPDRSRLSDTQLRRLFRAVQEAYHDISDTGAAPSSAETP